MAEISKMELLDFAAITVKFKKKLAIIFIGSLIVSYLGIYFFIGEEYQASATIISIEDNTMGGLAALAKNISSLPVGLGGVKKGTDMDRYNTIIFSRTCVETLIVKFDLKRLYGFQQQEDAVKAIRKMIKSDITLDNAYVLSVQVKDPRLAADMANFLVSYLNDRIIELNVAKSKDNRIFLENRYAEVLTNLALAEDSLRAFQENKGVIEAVNQIKATVEVYAKMDAEMISKQMESDVLAKLYGENAAQAENAKIVADEFQKKIESMKNGKGHNSILLDLNSLPAKGMQYFRLYRSVQMFAKVLEFVVPLYEQAKFEERKDVPILQVIDKAIPPEKKSYPPRTILAMIIAISAVLFSIVYLIVHEAWATTTNPKLVFIKNELTRIR